MRKWVPDYVEDVLPPGVFESAWKHPRRALLDSFAAAGYAGQSRR